MSKKKTTIFDIKNKLTEFLKLFEEASELYEQTQVLITKYGEDKFYKIAEKDIELVAFQQRMDELEEKMKL